MKILVCGGRDFNDQFRLFHFLDLLHLKKDITQIISGAARGADTLAAEWAHARGIDLKEFPADWDHHGKSAGAIRNKQMLVEGQPDGVVATEIFLTEYRTAATLQIELRLGNRGLSYGGLGVSFLSARLHIIKYGNRI